MNTTVPIVRAIISEALREPGNSGTVAFARVCNGEETLDVALDDGGADIDVALDDGGADIDVALDDGGADIDVALDDGGADIDVVARSNSEYLKP